MSTPMKDALAHIDHARLGQIADTLLAGGQSPDDVAQHIADLLDVAIPFALLVPPPLGELLEAVDGPIFGLIAHGIVKVAVKRRGG
jgi:hypothetical protein